MAETTAPATPGWSFTSMLADPNFQLLLANMGKAADPEGVGGVIGGAAANMISSKAAQTAVEKRDAARQAQIKQLIELHGGLTAPDKPGLNSIKATPAGSLAFDLNLQDPGGITGTPEYRDFSNTLSTIKPAAAPAPVRTQPLVAPVTTTGAQVAPTSTAQMRTAARRQPDITDIAPFY